MSINFKAPRILSEAPHSAGWIKQTVEGQNGPVERIVKVGGRYAPGPKAHASQSTPRRAAQPSKPSKAKAAAPDNATLAAKLIAKGRVRAAEALLGVAPGTLNTPAHGGVGPLDPQMAAAFGLAPKPAQKPRLVDGLHYLGDAPIQVPTRKTPAPVPQGRLDGNRFYLETKVSR